MPAGHIGTITPHAATGVVLVHAGLRVSAKRFHRHYGGSPALKRNHYTLLGVGSLPFRLRLRFALCFQYLCSKRVRFSRPLQSRLLELPDLPGVKMKTIL